MEIPNKAKRLNNFNTLSKQLLPCQGNGNGSLPVGKFDLAFAPQINHFNGKHTVQLKVLDWRAAT